MKNLSNEKPKTKWYGRPIAIIVSLGLIVFFGLGIWGMARSYREALHGRERVEKDLQKIEEQSTEIDEGLKQLTTERGQEEEFRTRYRAVKPGEQLIIVVPPDGDEQVQVKESVEKESLWVRFGAWLQRVF
jgi:cell division protein FtsB